MATAQTLSMIEIHRRASRRITLRVSPTSYHKGDNSSLPERAKARELRKPKLPNNSEKPPTTVLLTSRQEESSVPDAVPKTAEESKDDYLTENIIQRSEDGSSPFSKDRQQGEQMASSPDPRQSFEERLAALRKAVEPSPEKLDANFAWEHRPSVDPMANPSPDGDDKSMTHDEDESEDFDVDSDSYRHSSGLRTSVTTDTYLTEVFRQPGGDSDQPKLTHDILEFTVLDEDMNPLPTLSWVSEVTAGSITRGVLQKGHVRYHAAAKLDTDSRSLGLWYDDWPLENNASDTTSTEPPMPRRVGVKILLDPYIRLIYDGDVHVLDYSNRYYQKVDLPIGMIRKDVKAKLNVSRNHELSLFIQGRELIDDRVPLRTRVAFSKDVCQGFQPLYIFANVELKYKDCIVCGDEVAIEKFKSEPFTSACTHDINTCTPCLRHWLDETLTNKGHDKITCPECTAPFKHNDVKACASRTQFERYDSLTTRAALSVIDNFHWCLNQRCESGQIHHDDSPIFVCMACGYKQCIRHEGPWHEGETCREYNYRVSGQKKKDEEALSKRTIQRISKKCPGARCGARIQKNQGCDHMTCRKCKHEFCWVCLAAYGPIRTHGNRMHKPNCRHFADWQTTGDIPTILIP